MKKLALITIVGLAVSAVCLGAAATIGVREFSGGNINLSMFDDGPRCGAVQGSADNRQFAWDGGDSIAIEVPATVHYQPGPGQMVHIKGDPQMLAHVRVKDGKIDLDCHGFHHWHHDRLDITLPGREFREYHIAGIADLDLKQLNQTSLKISIAGSGDVTATGRADDLKIDIAGRGDAHMKDLAVKNLKLDIAGRGDVETAPQDDADISIAGSGDVKLYSEPKHLDTSVMGSGNIEHLAAKS